MSATHHFNAKPTPGTGWSAAAEVEGWLNAAIHFTARRNPPVVDRCASEFSLSPASHSPNLNS